MLSPLFRCWLHLRLWLLPFSANMFELSALLFTLWAYSASASNPVFQLEGTQCFVVCPLCFAFDMHYLCEKADDIDSVCPMFRTNPACWSETTFVVCALCFAFDMYSYFVTKMMTLTQCALCFVQIQHVEVHHVLWCAQCVLLRKGWLYSSGSTSRWMGVPMQLVDFARAVTINPSTQYCKWTHSWPQCWECWRPNSDIHLTRWNSPFSKKIYFNSESLKSWAIDEEG